MKNVIVVTFILFALLISYQHSHAVEIKLVLDKQNKTYFYRANEPLVDKQSYELKINRNEQIKFIIENASVKKPVIKFINAKRELPIDSEIFKFTNFIVTDENQVLNHQKKSLSLNDTFEILFAAEGDTDVNYIHFIIKYFKEPISNNTVGSSVPIQLISQEKVVDQKTVRNTFLPGCAVTDAIALNTKNALTYQQLFQLLSHYFPTASDETKIITEAGKNDFLKQIDFKQLFEDAKSESVSIQGEGSGLISNLSFSSIGGLDVTNIADGFAKFIVKRTKEELNIAFFEKLKNDLENPQFKDIQTLFPKTYSLLLTVGKDIYSYQRYLENLREAFKGDLDDLVKNLPSVIQNHNAFFKLNPELAAALNSACYVATELQNQTHPGDILANYPISHLEGFSTKYPAAVMQTLKLINLSMRKISDKDTMDDYWVEINQVRNMVNDKKTFKIYLGLFLQETINNYGDIIYDSITNLSLVSILEKIAGSYDKTYSDYYAYKQFILQFAQKTQSLNTMIRTYKDQPLNDSASFELYAKYFITTVDLLEFATKASELPYISGSKIGNLHETLKPYFDITYKTVDLSLDINRKNYASAINNAVNIYDLVKTRKEIETLKRITKPTKSSKEYKKSKTDNENNIKELNALQAKTTLTPEEKERFDALTLANSDFKELENNYNNKEENEKKLDSLTHTLNKLASYGALFSTVAQAKNSDEVENAIETFALPTGSYRIKKESNWNVSANAFCGFYGGYESIQPFRLENNQAIKSFGITAPIGIAVSKGIPGWSSSVSLFASIIDLGAITAFRFENDTTKSLSKIELRDIVSPGLFISFGLPKIPVSLNIGYQMAALLRSVDETENTYGPNYARISASICVDIPIVNIYTKTKN